MVDEYEQKHFKGTMLGVPVRYTDAKRPRSIYDRATQQMLEKHPNANLFLCTDNKDVIREYEKRYSKVITRNKWFPKTEGESLYRNKSCPDLI